MNINTWTPDSQLAGNTPDANSIELKQYIDMGSNDNIEAEATALNATQINALTPLMKQSIEYWHKAAEKLSSREIISLIRFFTVAEEKQSQLFAGKQSPVIALNKLLKKRNEPLSKDELLWIKAHSSNRYLPNGSAL